MVDWIGAAQISAVNISAITGSFSDLSVTGRLSANSISADVQNVKVLYQNDAGNLISVRDTYEAITLSEDILDYDLLEIIGSYAGATDNPGTGFGSGSIPTTKIRTTMALFNLVSYQTGFGTNWSLHFYRTAARTLMMARNNSDDRVWLHMILGIKQP